MNVAADPRPEGVSVTDAVPKRRSAWDICELAIGYGLILAVIWTPKPLQRWLYFGTLAWFILSIVSSFPGWKSMGCSLAGFWRSLWVVGVALVFAVTATMLASNLHTLHHPGGPVQWISTFAGYTIFALAQQFLLQGYFLLRLLRILPNGTLAAVTAATVFALAHLPNPILTPVTLLWGLVASLVFLKSRNIYPLAIAHAIFGICLAVTIPGPVLHNMRVGLGYLNYHAPRRPHLSQIDHRVSTDAWVRADAPTRR
jgi:membrane protease YdiL (CAAX protease family)